MTDKIIEINKEKIRSHSGEYVRHMPIAPSIMRMKYIVKATGIPVC